MTDRTLPVAAIMAAGIGLGFAGDQLLRVDAGPGLNFFLLFVGLAVSIWSVTLSAETRLGREAGAWVGVGLLCAAALLWRGSGLLRFMAFVAACTAFALPALDAGRAWVRRSGMLDVVEALVGSGLHAAFGGVRLISRASRSDAETDESRGAARSAVRTALVGILLAAIPLTVFGALFISADRVFARIVGDFVRIDLEAFAGHLLGTAILAWLVCGYLVGVVTGTRLTGLRRHLPSGPALGIAEIGTALGLVDLLFLGFVVVQFRYLFGGVGWVEVTPGLTYAEYARAGFFQLVAAVALAVPWLLTTHALLGDRGLRARAMFNGFAGVQLLLLFVIVASAIQRMRVYQGAYGLTEDRIVVTAMLAWLTVLLVWFGVTVLGGRRDRFVFGALAAGFVMVGALQFLDPAGLAARHNLDRAGELEVDADHLVTLGSDAVPLVIARFDELPGEARCRVAKGLLRRWGPERPGEWKSFNWSESRAREAVAADLPKLRGHARPPECG